ncbi:MAG: MFS transporter [Alphaproteobacteria bacterium]
MQKRLPPLLISRRFSPLLTAQFLGAFHDNLFKSALVVLLLYNPAFQGAMSPQILTTLAAGVFILPFLLFSPLAGQLADKFSRGKLIRCIKAAEIGIALVGITALMAASIQLCFFTLFCLGTHSALFGPARYAIIPDKLQPEELIGGNALLNMVIFIAILTGTIGGTVLVAMENGPSLVSGAIGFCAVTGFIASLFIPAFPAQYNEAGIHLNVPKQIWHLVGNIFRQSRDIVFSVMGIGWFYFLGAMFMAQFANYTYTTLGASEAVLTMFLTVFSVGVAGGSLLSDKLLKGQVKASLVPIALIGITLFSLDFYLANEGVQKNARELLPLSDFVATPAHWRIIADLFLIAMCGGLFEVPLNAVIQHRTPENARASVLAGSALINAFFVILSSVISAAILGTGWSMMELFLAFSLGNLGITVFVWWLMICERLPD